MVRSQQRERLKTFLPSFASALSVLFLVSCTGSKTSAPSPVKASSPASNSYVSMAPSNTELLFSIDAEDNLAGVCTQCDYPPGAKSLPKMGNFVTADLEKLAQVRPKAVFLVDGQEPMGGMIDNQTAFKTRVEILPNESIGDISKNLMKLGVSTGHVEKAARLSAEFDSAVAGLRKTLSSSSQRPRVFFCIWPEPLVAVGKNSYLNDAVTICGGTNIAGNLAGGYLRFNLERLLVDQPDVIIMPAEAERNSFDRPPWTSLRAVKNKRLYILPSRELDRLSRPTLRTIEGLYWLAERIHPELSAQLSMSKNSIHPLSATTAGNP